MPDDQVIHTTETIDDGLVVRVGGEIDMVRSPRLRSELMGLLREPVRRLVIDLSDVPFMDSSGVATLVETLKAQNNQKNKLVLCAMQSKVRSIFEIARLDMVFTITDDVAAAAKV